MSRQSLHGHAGERLFGRPTRPPEQILKGEVHGVIAGLRRMATQRRLSGRQEIDTVCGCFTTHAHRMQYHTYLDAG